ncbi:hypothetical protein F444_15519, partial [Phytophthora nicotianae P1976]
MEDFIDIQKRRLKVKNELERCQVCSPNGNQHQMRYIIYKCNSTSCSESASSLQSCNWFVKVLFCQETLKSNIFQSGVHLSTISSPKTSGISLGTQRFIRERDSAGEKPSRVMNEMVLHFKLESADPRELLPRVQTRVWNHRKNILNGNDYVDEMEALIQKNRYSSGLGDNVAFAFGYAVGYIGEPKLGEGSDEIPLVVGFATKTSIRRLQYANSYMTHLDATFKLNTRGFPVIAVGVSELWRQFHLVCMFLVSDLKQPQWEHAICSMLNMYVTVTSEQVHISYVMMDADAAQRSAFESIAAQCLDVESQP